MLKLTNIVKDYVTGDTSVRALKGIDIEFRKSEFVSILGPSGCGKTTMLNIIGGLDKYTSGDLIINGRSTKEFKDSDWDTYRNHSIGFVFQSYNLISHQTVLSNVELAMTLSGVSKSERRKRAKDALERVGLGDQLNKKPNQMSGGQMQRVAIARALVNDPDIILADEPTGALDSTTSVQIMEILKEISKEKLIIMVTHNPELAEEYSTRIVRFLDGELKDDSNPYKSEEVKEQKSGKKEKKPSMSFFTAISLSFNNLLTKKGRTFLTAFAGSIGIIGIALILALSSGVQNYITKTEKEALANYPLTITKESSDFSEMFTAMSGKNEKDTKDRKEDTIYSNNMMGNMLNTMIAGVKTNNMKDFKAFIESGDSGLEDYVSDIQYSYSTPMNIYKADTEDGLYKVNPSTVFEQMGMQSMVEASYMSAMNSGTEMDVWTQLPNNKDYLESQYDVLAGKLPENYDEAVIITDDNGEISDYCLYALGIEDMSDISQMVKDSIAGKEAKITETEETTYSYDELMELKYKLLNNTEYYKNNAGVWTDMSEDNMYVVSKLADALEIKIVGVVKKIDKDNAVSSGGGVGYRSDLMEYLVGKVNESDIVKQQKENPDVDVFTGVPFETDEDKENKVMSMEELKAYLTTLPEEQQAQIGAYIQQMQASGMPDDEIASQISMYMMKASTNATYDGNLSLMGVSDIDEPTAVNIYPKDFEAKDDIEDIIDKYNKSVENEEDEISYTDYIGLMLSSVTTIINAITYVLVGFVSISLIVSSIMIGIITYISVLERTKEIGILRAIGASKKDISRVFNAETFIIGVVSGCIGIGATVLLCIPINMVIDSLVDISDIAVLPWKYGVILVIISMVLTMVAGLIPSKMAAKKDPVVALRTE
ncbi:MAG: ABC transporter ATP-binding protein/permease [Lachnospiraceae bacterium]|nr:ABC transporter ATP-binding protein/permease [Lachnospiraceae bacterium]MDE6251571.1 ABC transporter ATP-binding protein/permease [Lachnospiraceae bacterium]